MMSLWLIAGDVNVGPLVKVMPARMLHFEAAIFFQLFWELHVYVAIGLCYVDKGSTHIIVLCF